MAKYADGTNYGKQADPTADNIVDQGVLGGKVRVMLDTYTFGATSLISQDYVVVGGKLPAGSQVVSISLTGGACQSTASSTVIIGDEGDDNRYLTNSGLSASNVLVAPNVATGMYYTITGTTDNYIRVAGGAVDSHISGAVLKVAIMYVAE